MSAVIRRGTRRYRTLLERAHDVHVFRLDDAFVGKPVPPQQLHEAVDRYPALRRRLWWDDTRHEYVLTMHNSWWFTFKDPT